jgi:glycosyltransferase involved in cell wall biosynthesis
MSGHAGGGVTVVVAARNASATLGGAVRSALASVAAAQCVVVDDASDDDTAAVAAALGAEDPRVELVSRPVRGGPAAARNDGLSRAKGTRVCFLDADDVLTDDALGVLDEALAAHRGAVVALGRFRAVDDAGASVDVGRWADDQLRAVVRRHGRVIESPDGLVPEALVTRLVSPPPGAWLVDTACARALGGFDPAARRSEDLEFLVRLAAAGSVVTVDRVVLDYRRHDAQRSAATTRRRWGRGHALWVMLRAAPSAREARCLAHGIAAYHLELFTQRRGAGSLRVRAMGLRNLVAAGAARVGGAIAALLPRRTLRALPAVADAAVD